ncbi:sestrin-2 [Hyperolius riggenbachi]|uniref:sestrin-2 n=1 Tax=Hyperolius riggenbachi TaxID=752182 RepID=UPI0035A37C68
MGPSTVEDQSRHRDQERSQEDVGGPRSLRWAGGSPRLRQRQSWPGHSFKLEKITDERTALAARLRCYTEVSSACLAATLEAICSVAPIVVGGNHCICPRLREDCYPGSQLCSAHRIAEDQEEQNKCRAPKGPSAYIPLSQLPGPPLSDNIAAVMSLHPEYLQIFWKTQHFLLRMDGALSLPERHYLAIMAAARHRCVYLVSLHSASFLQVGGDPKWLEGLASAPLKLRRLNDLNQLLAHRPWLISKEHIQTLLKFQEGHFWSLAEVMQALVLLTHFHALSSFILGCGIYPPQWKAESSRPPSPDFSVNEGLCTPQEAERVLAEIKRLDEEEQEATREEMETRFEREKRECIMVNSNNETAQSAWSPGILCFLEDPDFGYIDFTRRGEQAPPTLHAHDFTWENHGYSLLQRVFPEIGQLLDDKFQLAYNLTYHTIASHRGVDTFKLRRAIWNYIHCIYGIRHDDYNYGEVNQLLERSLKLYMKTVTCHPQKVTRLLYNNFWQEFRHSEKVHLNLLLLEARLQAALLYGLRAITRYMT